MSTVPLGVVLPPDGGYTGDLVVPLVGAHTHRYQYPLITIVCTLKECTIGLPPCLVPTKESAHHTDGVMHPYLTPFEPSYKHCWYTRYTCSTRDV